jgi:hydrogenase expression/formation protein HypD
VKKPTDCKLFGTVCTPENPMGSCMVSSEGACAAYWTYGRFRAPASASEEKRHERYAKNVHPAGPEAWT